MKTLEDVAIKAFYQGSDYFRETVTGIGRKASYNSNLKYWVVNLQLVQDDGHPCTSGIGFYLKGDELEVCSGHIVFSIKITPEIQNQLDVAPIYDF